MEQLFQFKPNVMLRLAVLTVLYGTGLQAQETLLAMGGDISSSGGSVNFSVGQTIQETIGDSNNIVIQGIQFYHAASTLEIIDLETNLNVSTYPNPTSSTLNLKVSKTLTDGLTYNLFNLLGEPIINGKITNNTTEIDLGHLPNATYLLKISNNTNIIKTFKIIKN